MDVNLDIEIFDPNCNTTLVIDDTVNVLELIDYIQQTFQDKFQGVDVRTISIRIGGTNEIIQPTSKSLRDVLRQQKKAKLFFQKGQVQSPSVQFQQSMSQKQFNQQQTIDQFANQTRNNPQVPQAQTQINQTQQQQNSPIGRTIQVIVKNGPQQIQVQLDDSVTIIDVIQHFQENMHIDLKQYNLFYGQVNLSLMNQNMTLKQLGMSNTSQLEWKLISQISQRVSQPPNMVNQNIPIGQNFVGQTQLHPQNIIQQTNVGQQQQYQQPQQYQQQQQQPQQQLYQQQQQQQPFQQPQQQYGQQQNLGNQQQQQGQISQQQQGNQQQTSSQQVQKGGKQININFEILDGSLKRQFSTIAFTSISLSELLDAVYQYLGISKDVASVDLYISGSPFGGNKLQQSLELLQLTKDNQTLQVKIRWIGG